MRSSLKEKIRKRSRRPGLILAAALMLAIPGAGLSYGAETVPQDLIPRPINRISQPSQPASTPQPAQKQWTAPVSSYTPSSSWRPASTRSSRVSARTVKVNALNDNTVHNYKVKQIKTGRSKLTFKWGIVNFKAPRTKTYTFTFSDLTGGSLYNQQIRVMFFSGNNSLVVRTKYGRNDTIGLMSARLSNKIKADYVNFSGVVMVRKQVVKVKVKKGKSIQLCLFAPNMTTTHKMLLNIQ